MSEWLVDWCLALLSVAVRVLMAVFGVEEEHRPKHALQLHAERPARRPFMIQGEDPRALPHPFIVRVGRPEC